MVETIYSMGDDALSNAASMTIATLPGIFDTVEDLQLRIKTFDIPEYSVKFYEVTYKGEKIEKPKPGNDVDKTVSVSFRLDKQWKCYNLLKKWGQAIYNHEAGDTGLGDVDGVTRTTIIIKADNGPTWTFMGAIFSKLSNISFDTTSEGDPIEVTFDFKYLQSMQL